MPLSKCGAVRGCFVKTLREVGRPAIQPGHVGLRQILVRATMEILDIQERYAYVFDSFDMH